ncbi:MAG: ABC transporter ATP-binding protein [Lachnospiraceae bacterium]|nr:ABC transporter ATP-binding protein [Lachnospiraceae bacterium]
MRSYSPPAKSIVTSTSLRQEVTSMPLLSNKTARPKDTKGTLIRLLSYLNAYRVPMAIGLVLSIAGNLFALYGPKLAGKAIGAIGDDAGKADFTRIYYYLKLLLLLYVGSAVCTFLLSVLMMKVGRAVGKKLRSEVFDKLMTMPVGYFDTHQTGDIISRVSYDIDVISNSLSTDVVQILSSLITVTGAFIMMLTICPPLVLAVLITIPLSIFYTRYITRKARPLLSARSAMYGEMNGYSEEMFSGQKTIQAYAHENLTLEEFDGINEKTCEAFYNADYISSKIGPSIGFINNLSLALTAMFGSIFYMKSIIDLSQISSFVLYTRKFSGPINEVANIANEILSSLAAAERVFNLLNESDEIADLKDAVELTDVRGEVELEDVNFSYRPEKPILRDINIHAEAGKMIAIVGPTGSGKTTIINLLMRFYEPVSGQIYVDDTPHEHFTMESLRKAYALVLQDTWVFHGTIYDNIAYGRIGATRDEVVAAAKAAHIHHYIMCLPQGYDTVITEDGGNISKGQKQLLTIARAMLYDAKMLILDEATSNVDTRTERRIQKAMRTLMKDKTCFVIAHRLSTIQNADTILVIGNGTVVEAGTHEELMERKGRYYNLYQAQFE